MKKKLINMINTNFPVKKQKTYQGFVFLTPIVLEFNSYLALNTLIFLFFNFLIYKIGTIILPL